MKFSVIITGWNCEKFVEPCLDSIKNQTLQPFEIIMVDDGSSDDSYRKMLANAPHLSTVMHLDNNQGTYYARDLAIKKATGDVIIMIDFDDCLLPNALELVNKEYNRGVFMTYGNYIFPDGKKCPVNLHYSEFYSEFRSYRRDPIWRCTHLRTFSRELYNLIPKWDLTPSEIKSYPDVEILFSMMEMCGEKRIGVIEEPIYIYNTDNPDATLKRFGKDIEGYNEICNRKKRDLI